MSNSTLISYTHLSANNSGARTHSIDRITPHCVVGQWSAKKIADYFATSTKKASCNYGIGKDGSIALVVDESKRSWCSSNAANDQRAVTIECASDTKDPYTMTDEVYASLINLCVDICKRNGKTKLLWLGNKETALAYKPASDEMVITVHRWFANKACCGDWLYSRLDDLAAQVTAKLGSSAKTTSKTTTTSSSVSYKVKINTDVLNIRKGAGTNYAKAGTVKRNEVYTIVAEASGTGASKWGKLKSGAGWISLDHVKKV